MPSRHTAERFSTTTAHRQRPPKSERVHPYPLCKYAQKGPQLSKHALLHEAVSHPDEHKLVEGRQQQFAGVDLLGQPRDVPRQQSYLQHA